MDSNFYTCSELEELGLKSFGRHVLISRKASLYGAEHMSFGNHVRIDDFCILSGSISIGNHVHIAAYTALYGKYGIEIHDFCGISARGTLYSADDDFSGEHMVSPMVPDEFVKLTTGTIILHRYVQLGCNTVVFPGCVLHEGAATGAMTFVKTDVPAWSIAAGIPARGIKERKRNVMILSESIRD